MAYNYLRNITLRSRRKKANKLNIVSNNALGITYFTPMNEPDGVIGDLNRVSSYNVPPLIPEYDIPDYVLKKGGNVLSYYRIVAEECLKSESGFSHSTPIDIAEQLNTSSRTIDRIRKKLKDNGYLYYFYKKSVGLHYTKLLFDSIE